MESSLRRTWIAVVIATLAVVVAAFFTLREGVADAFVTCDGVLVREPVPEYARLDEPVSLYDGAHGLELAYDEVPGPRGRPRRFENVRIVWTPAPGRCACNDIELPSMDGTYGAHPTHIKVGYDRQSGRYVVRASESGDPLVAFSKREQRGRRFDAGRLFGTRQVPSAVVLIAIVALVVAAARARLARAYAGRIHAWTEARLRGDGLVETETGATLATTDPSVRERLAAGPVLVDPDALESRDIYRAMPLLGRRQIVVGSHERWRAGTLQRLRDARLLAVLSTLATGLALVARFAA